MRRHTKHILGVAAALGVALFIAWPDPTPNLPGEVESTTPGRPWEIRQQPDGSIVALGLSPGHSNLRDALQLYGPQVEAAVFRSPDGALSLEAYYSQVSLGGITGKLILGLDMPEADRESMVARSPKSEPQPTGSLRYELANQDADRVLTATVETLSFIPSVNLDEQTLSARFGTPDAVREGKEGHKRMLYRDDGLIIRFDPKGKEILEYMAPASVEGVWAAEG